VTSAGVERRADPLEAGLAYPGLRSQPDQGQGRGLLSRALKRFLRAQFGRPTGWWGQLAGRIMARTPSNLDRIEWTLSLLNVKSSDRILEIGFGPGQAIERLARDVREGLIAGIDHSEVMVQQATRRNAGAIRERRVILQVGSASNPPAFAELFDTIFTINSIHFWTEPEACLAKLRALLRPGGRIAVTLQPRSRNATDATTRTIGEELMATLARAGFSDCRLEIRPSRPVAVACALAVNLRPCE
jgi:SAM-dependent methyltransferase